MAFFISLIFTLWLFYAIFVYFSCFLQYVYLMQLHACISFLYKIHKETALCIAILSLQSCPLFCIIN